MSMYSSKLTILRHFLKTVSMIHMPPKPIASAGSNTIILCKKYISNQNIHANSSILFYFLFKKFDKIYMPPKPLAINHRAALAIIHR